MGQVIQFKLDIKPRSLEYKERARLRAEKQRVEEERAKKNKEIIASLRNDTKIEDFEWEII